MGSTVYFIYYWLMPLLLRLQALLASGLQTP
jgi:hypothetical protein